MKKFWELLEQSVIVQSVITLMMVSALVVIWLAPLFTKIVIEITPEMYAVIGTILGYWFGVKINYARGKETQLKASVFDQLAKRMGLDGEGD